MHVRLLASTTILCLMTGAAWAAEPPPPLECGTMAYPAEAAAYNLEGTTGVEYEATADGRLVGLSIKRSSGWRMLDEATIDILSGCRLASVPAAGFVGKRKTIEYVWSLDGPLSRQALVPGSCAPSDRFAGFRALDTAASAADGILVRAMIGAAGDPYYVKSEAAGEGEDKGTAELAALATAYLRSCRFALPPGERSPGDNAIFGRVLLK